MSRPVDITSRPLSPSERALLTVLTLVTLAVVPPFRDAFLLPKELCLTLGTMLALLLFFAEPKPLPVFWRGWSAWGLIAFFASVGLSTALARNPLQAMDWCFVFLGGLLFVWMGLAGGERFQRCWPRLVIALALAEIGLGVIEIVWLPAPDYFLHYPRRLLFIGTIGNPEYLASFLGMAFLLTVYEHWYESVPVRVAALTALGLGLLLTGSRGAWISLLSTLLLVPPSFLTKPRRKLLVIAVTTSLWLVGAKLGMLRTDLGTLRGRLLVWLASLKIIATSKGLGVGLGNFQYHFHEAERSLFAGSGWRSLWENASMVQRAHNESLDFLAEGGVALIVAVAIWLIPVFRRLHRDNRNPHHRACLGIFLFTLFAGLSSFPLHIIPSLLIFGLACTGGAIPEVRPLPRTARVLAMGLVVILSLPIAKRGFERSLAQYLHARAYAEIDQENYEDAQTKLEHALAACPDDYYLRVTFARVLYRRFRSREALIEIQKLLHYGPIIDTLKLEGLVRMDLGDWTGAFRVYDELAHVYPLQVTPHYYLGRIYERWGRSSEARQEFSKALALPAKNGKARMDQQRIRDTADPRVSRGPSVFSAAPRPLS